MKSNQLNENGFNELKLAQPFSPAFPLGQRTAYAPVQVFSLPGIQITFGHLAQVKQQMIRQVLHRPMVKLLFQLEGLRVHSVQDQGFRMQLGTHTHAMVFLPNSYDVYYQAAARQTFLEIDFNLELVLPHVKDFPEFETFLSQVKTGTSVSLWESPVSMTVKMTEIIGNIFASEREGALQTLFLEAKVKELLLLQIEHFQRLIGDDKKLMEKYHADKIYLAKSILEANVGLPCRLIDLAHQAGTNECTLKKGFKTLLDTTVHDYWTELKMKKALKMLEESDARVAEIAADTGYKNAKHFATSFKKRFGLSPIAAREHSRSLKPLS